MCNNLIYGKICTHYIIFIMGCTYSQRSSSFNRKNQSSNKKKINGTNIKST